MSTNKDTVKALNAAQTLVKYCGRYKNCDNCIFLTRIGLSIGCAINRPFSYVEIKEAQNE